MIDKKLIPVKGLKKEPFSGSHFGMRYYFCADERKLSRICISGAMVI